MHLNHRGSTSGSLWRVRVSQHEHASRLNHLLQACGFLTLEVYMESQIPAFVTIKIQLTIPAVSFTVLPVIHGNPLDHDFCLPARNDLFELCHMPLRLAVYLVICGGLVPLEPG